MWMIVRLGIVSVTDHNITQDGTAASSLSVDFHRTMKRSGLDRLWHHATRKMYSASLLTLKRRFTFLTTAILLFIFFLSDPHESVKFIGLNLINGVRRDKFFPLPLEQCPRKFKECPQRVLQRNEASKWIAVWVPAEPEINLSHLTQIPGWKTVVVGDGVCPRGCRFPDCVFLDPASQAILGSSLASLLPPNDVAKKNLAYLYAIKQRAQFIYDTNVNIRPLHNLSNFFYGNTSGLVYTGKGIFNYYKHYGEHWFHPPGFTQLYNEVNDPSAYILSDIPQPEIQHGLVNVNSGPRFQSSAPTVFTGPESFAPFDSSNTMFHSRAFWGLFTFPGPSSDTVRSYFIQTLLKYIHGYVGFLHTNAKQERISSSTESDQRRVPKSLVWFLYQWQCRDNASLGSCFNQLAADLLRENVISNEGLLMTTAWLSDLMVLSYDGLDLKMSGPYTLAPQTNKLDHGATAETVEFSPNPGVYYQNNPETQTYNCASTICKNFTYPLDTPYRFSDILLIVTFNYAHLYENICYVEALYRRYFPNILFCGPSMDTFRSVMTSLPVNSSVAYVTGIERGWMYFQECTVYAMKMNFNVRGYLQIGDDTLVNPWNLKSLSRDRFWLNSVIVNSSRSLQIVDDRWNWWPKPYGKAALDETFRHIEAIAAMPGNTKEKRFYQQYMENVRSFSRMFRQKCDFFFIPNRLKDEFIYFTKLFFKSTLLVEAAIPTMILGLDEKDNIARVTGKVIMGKRYTPERRFNVKDHYLHAFKGRSQMKVLSSKTFICKSYLPLLVKKMSKNTKLQ